MICDRIKELREKNGLTQSALAKKFGLTRSAVNAWEMGISVPSAQYLIALSRLFKVSTDYLLELDHRETIDITALREEEKQLMYDLMGYFEKYQNVTKALEQSDYAQLEEEYAALKRSGSALPPQLQNFFDSVFQ